MMLTSKVLSSREAAAASCQTQHHRSAQAVLAPHQHRCRWRSDARKLHSSPSTSLYGFGTHRKVTAASSSLQRNPSTSAAAAPQETGSVTATVLKFAARACVLAVIVSCIASIILPSPSWAAGSAAGSQNLVTRLVDFALHLDKHLSQIIAEHGRATYLFLFGIVFCETGLVVTPFLPGDSLLFAAGAMAALGHLDVLALSATFIVAATIGDAVNYAIGQFFGRKALQSRLINPEYVGKTEKFYEKYGAKTIVLARFVPIVRTFAPFVAGIGSMAYSTFAAYNVGGAALWTVLFVGAGYLFGNLPFVQHNFTLVVLAIVAVSVLPIAAEVWAARREAKQAPGSDSLATE